MPDPSISLAVQALLKQFGIESTIDVVLMGWVAICLECKNQSCYPGCENNQIAGTCPRRVGVRHARWHKHCSSRASAFGSVGVAEREFAIDYMPGFVIGVVDMQGCRTTASPFVDTKRIARSGEGRWWHSQILPSKHTQ